MDRHDPIEDDAIPSPEINEKNEKNWTDIEVTPSDGGDFSDIPASKVLVPEEDDEFIDPRLKDYPIPLLA